MNITKKKTKKKRAKVAPKFVWVVIFNDGEISFADFDDPSGSVGILETNRIVKYRRCKRGE